MNKKFHDVLKHYQEICNTLSQQEPNSQNYISLSKECINLQPLVESIQELYNTQQTLHELTQLNHDPELSTLVQEEIDELTKKIELLEQNIHTLLLPQDTDDAKNVILEIRAGTGGLEAALFASDLFEMYRRYATSKKWSFETINITQTDIGGFKGAIAAISGKNVFTRLKFESGVHRVQRIPITESKGRIHTSTATVAVLPEPEEVDVKIDEKDLRIDVFRASGPGGQSVNTTDSAIRITHIPTGIVVSQQDEKSQYRNKMTALRILRTRLYDLEQTTKQAQRSETRKNLVGRGDRSERIRTYNFPQGRISDHRIHRTVYAIENFMNGQGLDEFIDTLIQQNTQQKLLSEPLNKPSPQ